MWLRVEVHRVRCRPCGVRTERLPFVGGQAHYTARVEAAVAQGSYLDTALRGRGTGRALVETVVPCCRRRRRAARPLVRHALRPSPLTGERTLPGDLNDTREYGFERDV